LEPRIPANEEAADSDKTPTRKRFLDMTKLRFPTAFRLLKIWHAFKEGESVEEIHNLTKIDPWFLRQPDSQKIA
ncbi:MAG: hypothetical protein GF372_12225, partial [Candidatus Marinimicrobia bacterium]|nr:hypothetical protein [Candidatus Neomarinimicrobiota bacterium]